jgi:hypothetical protein
VHGVRLLPRFGRFNAKREVWPGGPQIGQVIEAQLTPGGAQAASDAEEPEPKKADHTVELLLLLR